MKFKITTKWFCDSLLTNRYPFLNSFNFKSEIDNVLLYCGYVDIDSMEDFREFVSQVDGKVVIEKSKDPIAEYLITICEDIKIK